MSATYTGTDPRLLRQLEADIAQLTRPIHMAVQRRIITHPALLDQLNDAAFPGRTGQQQLRRTIPDSRPPSPDLIRRVDALVEIAAELDQWRTRITLPVAGTRRTLHAIPGVAQQLAPAIAEWLTLDVHHWWHTAAVQSGWRPEQLLRIR
jgi:hypothetical protein